MSIPKANYNSFWIDSQGKQQPGRFDGWAVKPDPAVQSDSPLNGGLSVENKKALPGIREAL